MNTSQQNGKTTATTLRCCKNAGICLIVDTYHIVCGQWRDYIRMKEENWRRTWEHCTWGQKTRPAFFPSPLRFFFSLSLSSSTFLNMFLSSLFSFWSRFLSPVKALNFSSNLLCRLVHLCSQSRTSSVNWFWSLKWAALQFERVDSLLECTDGVGPESQS